MEDILASIRRILSEDEAKPGAPGAAAPEHPQASAAAAHDDVLMLDSSMLVEEPQAAAPKLPLAEPPSVPDAPRAAPPIEPRVEPPAQRANPFETHAMEPEPILPPPSPQLPPAAPPTAPFGLPQSDSSAEALVAPEAAAAAATSVGSLLRHLQAERQMAVHRGGPTIEDIVREEMRPILKQWLDAHLPPLVERLVRAEIERVVARSVS
jgi:cell pole-organizing protein PopZ